MTFNPIQAQFPHRCPIAITTDLRFDTDHVGLFCAICHWVNTRADRILQRQAAEVYWRNTPCGWKL